ncbi:MAG: sulfatase [Angelakisella sp.]
MKTIFLLFDSLNRRALSPYGCNWVKTPNFERLSMHTVTYDNCYTASLPCMPARRDFQTGRLSFLHRSWGPMEPYDKSVTELLSNSGVYTHLISDHIHYWEEGGSNYHTKYNSWEIVRGQEGDKWCPSLEKPDTTQLLGRKDEARAQDMVNRVRLKARSKYPIDELFEKAERFLAENSQKDNWFLQVESFDPHEPFFAHQRFRDLYPHDYDGREFDWPDYCKVTESPAEVEHCRYEYAALVSACDEYLGKILDIMDKEDMWKDTALIVTTDHGYLLGEHGWWAKTVQPIYNEIAHIPLFMWNPNTNKSNEHSSRLVQITDVAPTLLPMYNIAVPTEMTGVGLDAPGGSKKEKRGCLFGIHGCFINVTDGRYVYMKKPLRQDGLYNYTLMPNHMKKAFSKEEINSMEIEPPLPFTNGYYQLKIPAKPWAGIDFDGYEDMLFDLESDSGQLTPIKDAHVTEVMKALMVALMKENDAPREAFAYWGLEE